MTSDDFLLIEKYFEQLVDLTESQQQAKLVEISDRNKLTEEKLNLLKAMLAADKNNNIPDQLMTAVSSAYSQDSTAESFIKGTRIGDYQLIKQIGAGGMGQVFLAARSDGEFNQKVAIKMAHFTFDQKSRQQFENERQILAKLSHANIAHLLTGGTTDQGQPYLVMEYIDGIPIDRHCKEQHTSLKDRISLLIQICSAVSFAHSKLILHRDLKPDNILINTDGVVKLLDFGIAKLIDENHFNYTATQVMTRQYASPEQIQGKPVSTQSDIFSIGVIAYELITGFHPFPHRTVIEREQNVLSGKILKIKERSTSGEPALPTLYNIPDRQLQGDLENILRKALSPDPFQRYETLEAFANDLKNFLANKPVIARKPNSSYVLKKWIQRHKGVSISIALFVITLISATLFSIHKTNETLAQKQIAIEQKQQAEQLRTLAEAEAFRANKISEFMQNIFTNAKPQANKEELTARDLLDQGLSTVQTELQADPENKYKIIDTLTEVLINLSEYELATKSFQENYNSCVTELSAHDSSCQSLLIHMANIHHNIDQPAQSVDLLNQALSIAKSEVPQNKQLIGSILRIKFQSLVNLQQLDKALQSTEEGINYLQSVGMSEEEIVSSYNDLSFLAIRYKKFKEADNYFNKMEHILFNLPEKNYLEIAKLVNMRGFSLNAQKKYLQAAKLRNQAVNILVENFDQPFEVMGLIQYTSSQTWLKAGNSQMALVRAMDAFDTYSKISDNTHPKRQNLLLHIANINFLMGRPETAKSYMHEVQQEQLNDRLCDQTKAQVFLALSEAKPDAIKENIVGFETCAQDNRYLTDSQIYLSVFRYQLALIEDNSEDQDKHHAAASAFWQDYPNENSTLNEYFKRLGSR